MRVTAEVISRKRRLWGGLHHRIRCDVKYFSECHLIFISPRSQNKEPLRFR